MTSQNKFQKVFCKLPDILFSLMMMGILFICLFLSKMYSTRGYLGISEPIHLLLLGFGICLTIGILYILKKSHLNTHIKINKKFFLCAFILCFIFQVIASYHYYFFTDWDVKKMFDLSSAIAHHESITTFNDYFSRYPNNLILSSIFSCIISMMHKLGLHSYEYFALICLQCFINTTAGLLIVTTLKQLFHNDCLCLIGYLFYLCLVAISPWVTVPYSDSVGLFFPILIFSIYVYNPKKCNYATSFIKWCSIALLSYIGYKIKPQIIILFLGIIITELYIHIIHINEIKGHLKQTMKGFRSFCIAAVLGFVMAALLANPMIKSTHITLNPEQAFGPTHFLMMGINPETIGIYNRADVDFSGSFSTKAERNAANLQVTKERIQAMGPSNIIRHMTKKVLLNYNDGTFFWGGEGTFYKKVLPEKNHYISSFFRNLYYNRDYKGKYYSIWANFAQMIWLTILFFAMLSGFFCKEKKITVVMISIIGLTLFELIFEARARYLFAYVPLYIILAVCGIKFLLDKWEQYQKRKISKH